jgi:hypothetical protein
MATEILGEVLENLQHFTRRVPKGRIYTVDARVYKFKKKLFAAFQ